MASIFRICYWSEHVKLVFTLTVSLGINHKWVTKSWQSKLFVVFCKSSTNCFYFLELCKYLLIPFLYWSKTKSRHLVSLNLKGAWPCLSYVLELLCFCLAETFAFSHQSTEPFLLLTRKQLSLRGVQPPTPDVEDSSQSQPGREMQVIVDTPPPPWH